MIMTYLRAALGLAAIAALVWLGNLAYQAGYQKAESVYNTAALQAVEEAKAQWEKEHAADEKIIEYVTRTQIEYVDRERVVTEYITRWKTPPGCTDLGESFRLLFNGQTDTGGTSEADRAEFEAAVQAALATAGLESENSAGVPERKPDNP